MSEDKAGEAEKVIRLSPIQYFKEVRQELGKVVWPTREETIRLTLVVLIVSAMVGFFIGGVDYILTKLTERFLR